MYDRYTITSAKKVLEDTFQAVLPSAFQPNFNASPTSLLPVITMEDPNTVRMMQWGFIPSLSNNKSISPKLFNLPAPGAFERPMYLKALAGNRCVILADGFFAWKQVSKKQRIPNYFYFKNQTPFGIAGIWEASEDIDGKVSESFNMMTAPSDQQITGYQEDMPLLLTREQVAIWLNENTTIDQLQNLVGQIETQGLLTHPVSPRINDPMQNHEDLIKPATPSDQFGNYTLFS